MGAKFCHEHLGKLGENSDLSPKPGRWMALTASSGLHRVNLLNASARVQNEFWLKSVVYKC